MIQFLIIVQKEKQCISAAIIGFGSTMMGQPDPNAYINYQG